VSPLMWLVRRIGSLRSRGKTPSAESDLSLTLQELRIVPVLNGLMTFMLRQEARLIQARRVLPFGSSLIAAARRKQ